jgi:hypothetical protein
MKTLIADLKLQNFIVPQGPSRGKGKRWACRNGISISLRGRLLRGQIYEFGSRRRVARDIRIDVRYVAILLHRYIVSVYNSCTKIMFLHTQCLAILHQINVCTDTHWLVRLYDRPFAPCKLY